MARRADLTSQRCGALRRWYRRHPCELPVLHDGDHRRGIDVRVRSATEQRQLEACGVELARLRAEVLRHRPPPD